DHGKNLTTVYVTHGYGDHWFGLGAVRDRFPGVPSWPIMPAATDRLPDSAGRTRSGYVVAPRALHDPAISWQRHSDQGECVCPGWASEVAGRRCRCQLEGRGPGPGRRR